MEILSQKLKGQNKKEEQDESLQNTELSLQLVLPQQELEKLKKEILNGFCEGGVCKDRISKVLKKKNNYQYFKEV